MVDCNTFVWQWRFYGVGGPTAPDPYVSGFTLGKFNEDGLIDYQYVEFNSLVSQSLVWLQEYSQLTFCSPGRRMLASQLNIHRMVLWQRRIRKSYVQHSLRRYAVVIDNSRIFLYVLFFDGVITFFAILRSGMLCFVCCVGSMVRGLIGCTFARI